MINTLQEELKDLIIEALVLEDITPAQIDSSEPLFVEGLGLDSIDALEIAMVLEQKYGVTMNEEDEKVREYFASIESLAKFVSENREKK
jgi:acyl carrier protein